MLTANSASRHILLDYNNNDNSIFLCVETRIGLFNEIHKLKVKDISCVIEPYKGAY